MSPEGLIFRQLACRGCGKLVDITVSWEELFYVAQNGPGKPLMLPEGWAYSDENLDCYLQAA